MKKRFRMIILTVLLLTLVGGTSAHAAISRPKNFRIVYKTEAGEELERVEYAVYAVQQVFLDKLLATNYIDPKGYEYNATGYRLQTWTEKDYGGQATADIAIGYYGILDALQRAYSTLDPPYSLQATMVLHPTGAKYSAFNVVRVLWLNQDSDLVKESSYTIGRGESYTDTRPEEYEILSVKAFMMDIWKINNETTIDPDHPTVKYDKFGEEYSIIYTLNLSREEENEILGITTAAPEESTEEAETESSGEALTESFEVPEETRTTQAETTKATTQNSTASSETETLVPATTKTDERASSGSSRVTLILGSVIALIVIYLAVISIGTANSKKKKKRKKRL